MTDDLGICPVCRSTAAEREANTPPQVLRDHAGLVAGDVVAAHPQSAEILEALATRAFSTFVTITGADARVTVGLVRLVDNVVWQLGEFGPDDALHFLPMDDQLS